MRDIQQSYISNYLNITGNTSIHYLNNK